MTESFLTTVSQGSCADLLGPLVEWVLEEMCIWIWASVISLRLFRESLMLQEWARTTSEKMRTSLSACHNTTELSKERASLWVADENLSVYGKRHEIHAFWAPVEVLSPLDKSYVVCFLFLCFHGIYLWKVYFLACSGNNTTNSSHMETDKLSSHFTLSRWKSSGRVL